MRYGVLIAFAIACAPAATVVTPPIPPGPGWTCLHGSASSTCFRAAEDCAAAIQDHDAESCQRAETAWCFTVSNRSDPEAHPTQTCLASPNDCDAAIQSTEELGDTAVESACVALH